MSVDIETINIKGNKYVILDKIEINNVTYVYLLNEKNENDFFIHKVIKKDGNDFLTGLDSEEEAKTAMQAYVEKNAKYLN